MKKRWGLTAKILILILCISISGALPVFSEEDSAWDRILRDQPILIGAGYNLAALVGGIGLMALFHGDEYSPGYGDYSLLAAAGFVSGTLEADGGEGNAGGIPLTLIRDIGHDYDDPFLGFMYPGSEFMAEFLVPLPLAEATGNDAFLASFAVTMMHYVPITFGANFILFQMDDGPLPFRVTLGAGDTWKFWLTQNLYLRPGVDITLFDRFHLHGEYYQTVFGRTLVGDNAALRESGENRLSAWVGYNFNDDYGIRLGYINGRSWLYNEEDPPELNAFTFSGLTLAFTGYW
jgi:hypothetical protein